MRMYIKAMNVEVYLGSESLFAWDKANGRDNASEALNFKYLKLHP